MQKLKHMRLMRDGGGGGGGGWSVAETIARTDKEQPPAVFQRERGKERGGGEGREEWGSACIEWIERGREREHGRREELQAAVL